MKITSRITNSAVAISPTHTPVTLVARTRPRASKPGAGEVRSGVAGSGVVRSRLAGGTGPAAAGAGGTGSAAPANPVPSVGGRAGGAMPSGIGEVGGAGWFGSVIVGDSSVRELPTIGRRML